MGGEDRSEEFLRVSISLPNFSLELNSANPDRALREVRRIVETLDTPDDAVSGLQLTDEFARNPALLERLRSALVLSEDVRVVKRVLPVEIVCGEGSAASLVLTAVREEILQLFTTVDRIRECFIHLRGELSTEQRLIVMDCVRHALGVSVATRFFSTPKNVEGRVLVEAVCFCAVG